MQALDFYDRILIPNVEAQRSAEGNVRHAVNAITSLDVYVGIWSLELRRNKLTRLSEEAFRDQLASRSSAYRLLRDMAFALKHGELTGTKPRLVTETGQLEQQQGAFQKDAFDPSFQAHSVVCIVPHEGGSRSVWSLLGDAMVAVTDLENDIAIN